MAASFRIRRHPHVRAAQADGAISVSYGRWISEVTKSFYPEDQDAVEEILVQAASSGAVLEDLVAIATAALRRLRPGGIEKDEAQRHAERGLTVSKTLDGVGRVNEDLTADATALADTAIEALAVKAGPEDTRTRRQRRHDAFAEAMRRLAGSGTAAAASPAATTHPSYRRSTTSCPDPEADPPNCGTCSPSAASTTSSPSTPGAGPYNSTPTPP
ncbi:MAG TPA: DUF222 domain-containing protein [Actinomadura sp.]|nr:DUF222 domain-containing protein [Actinomadura sp.]